MSSSHSEKTKSSKSRKTCYYGKRYSENDFLCDEEKALSGHAPCMVVCLLYHELFHMDFSIVVKKGKFIPRELFVKIFVLFTIKILVLH